MLHQTKSTHKRTIKLFAIFLIVICSVYYFFQRRDRTYQNHISNGHPGTTHLHQVDFSTRYSENAPHIVHVSREISSLPLFLSFSQFCEDAILYHIFQGTHNGFYVDIGAHHPTLISDTKIFYEMGWSGINIEPLEKGCSELKKQRSRDINLCIACGAVSGNMTLHENGVFTTLKDNVAAAQKNRKFTDRIVRVEPVAAILEKYYSETAEIHFMKVDVEGFEKEVLQGMDFTRFKPQILVVEALEPGTRAKSYLEWEQMVFEHGYDFLYEFQLNRFYCHHDYPELKNNFRSIQEIEQRFKLLKMW